MDDNNGETGPRALQRWVSLGDLLVLAASLVGISVSYGKLSADLAIVTREVREMQQRDITPGARVEIASIRAHNVSQDAQIIDMREELRISRRELLEEMRSISRALDEHNRESK